MAVLKTENKKQIDVANQKQLIIYMKVVVRGQLSVVCGILGGDHPARRFYNGQQATDY